MTNDELIAAHLLWLRRQDARPTTIRHRLDNLRRLAALLPCPLAQADAEVLWTARRCRTPSVGSLAMSEPQQEDPRVAAQDALYREIKRALDTEKMHPSSIHHLAEAYALATRPDRASGWTQNSS